MLRSTMYVATPGSFWRSRNWFAAVPSSRSFPSRRSVTASSEESRSSASVRSRISGVRGLLIARILDEPAPLRGFAELREPPCVQRRRRETPLAVPPHLPVAGCLSRAGQAGSHRVSAGASLHRSGEGVRVAVSRAVGRARLRRRLSVGAHRVPAGVGEGVGPTARADPGSVRHRFRHPRHRDRRRDRWTKAVATKLSQPSIHIPFPASVLIYPGGAV